MGGGMQQAAGAAGGAAGDAQDEALKRAGQQMRMMEESVDKDKLRKEMVRRAHDDGVKHKITDVDWENMPSNADGSKGEVVNGKPAYCKTEVRMVRCQWEEYEDEPPEEPHNDMVDLHAPAIMHFKPKLVIGNETFTNFKYGIDKKGKQVLHIIWKVAPEVSFPVNAKLTLDFPEIVSQDLWKQHEGNYMDDDSLGKIVNLADDDSKGLGFSLSGLRKKGLKGAIVQTQDKSDKTNEAKDVCLAYYACGFYYQQRKPCKLLGMDLSMGEIEEECGLYMKKTAFPGSDGYTGSKPVTETEHEVYDQTNTLQKEPVISGSVYELQVRATPLWPSKGFKPQEYPIGCTEKLPIEGEGVAPCCTIL